MKRGKSPSETCLTTILKKGDVPLSDSRIAKMHSLRCVMPSKFQLDEDLIDVDYKVTYCFNVGRVEVVASLKFEFANLVLQFGHAHRRKY